MNDKLAALIAAKKPVYKENPHWEASNEGIVDRKSGKPFLEDISLLTNIKPAVQAFFKHYYESFQSEAQVLLVTDEDYHKLPVGIPVLDSHESVYVVVLPQKNTWSNTIIDEQWWETNIVRNGITPLARIHSHHVLPAYQSYTDWSSLNSGTLEVVFGKVDTDNIEMAVWLDKRGTLEKRNVYKSVDGKTWNKIEAGCDRATKVAPDFQAVMKSLNN